MEWRGAGALPLPSLGSKRLHGGRAGGTLAPGVGQLVGLRRISQLVLVNRRVGEGEGVK